MFYKLKEELHIVVVALPPPHWRRTCLRCWRCRTTACSGGCWNQCSHGYIPQGIKGKITTNKQRSRPLFINNCFLPKYILVCFGWFGEIKLYSDKKKLWVLSTKKAGAGECDVKLFILLPNFIENIYPVDYRGSK